MSFNNLSKTFKYVNENGGTLIFKYANGYLINKPSGIDTVEVNLSQTSGINQVGGTVESKTVRSRPVTISGIVVGESQIEKKNKLIEIVRPDLNGKLYADDYYLDVSVTSTPTIEAKENFAHFQFSIVAPYPYWRKEERTEKSLSGVQNLFKFPWNISKSYQFGKTIETKFANIRNGGQVPVPFTATFLSNYYVDNPKITNAVTGDFLLVNKSLVPGERVVVEITHGRTIVTSSVDGDIRGALDLDSTLFRLGVGDNVLKPEADAGLGDLDVTIDYATEIAGIAL